jgi:hypothetical protein
MEQLESDKAVVQTIMNLRDIFDKVSLQRLAGLVPANS